MEILNHARCLHEIIKNDPTYWLSTFWRGMLNYVLKSSDPLPKNLWTLVFMSRFWIDAEVFPQIDQKILYDLASHEAWEMVCMHRICDVDRCDEAVGFAGGHVGHTVEPHCCFSTAVGIAAISQSKGQLQNRLQSQIQQPMIAVTL